jgi:hypothetical protein
MGGYQSDRQRIGVVVLAAVPDGKHPHPGGQLRGHVDDLNAVGA